MITCLLSHFSHCEMRLSILLQKSLGLTVLANNTVYIEHPYLCVALKHRIATCILTSQSLCNSIRILNSYFEAFHLLLFILHYVFRPKWPSLVYTIVYENFCSAFVFCIALKGEFSVWMELYRDGEVKILKVESTSVLKCLAEICYFRGTKKCKSEGAKSGL
jgi:hypothetical protein